MFDFRRSMRLLVAAVWIAALPAPASAIVLQPQTLQAWNAYVAATEARIQRELKGSKGFLVSDLLPGAGDTRARVLKGEIVIDEMKTSAPGGAALTVPDGLVSHWRGSVFLPGMTLETLLNRLQTPSERGPHQEDVLALRVLARETDALNLYIRMTRTKIVTVTYDTEHRIEYRHYGPTRASSRSVATKIAELDGAGTSGEREKTPEENRGFMWRLNSYWRYEQVAGGVIVELESLTLSRTVPLGLTPIVRPIIDRVARESMGRTLESLRRTYSQAAADRKRV